MSSEQPYPGLSGLKYHNHFPHPGMFSHLVIDGDYAHVSGQLAFDAEKKQVVAGTPEMETKRGMEQLRAVLADAGLGLNNITRVNLYITNLEHLEAINRVYGQFFPDGQYPARTCVVVAQLIGGCCIEIEATARIPPKELQ
ncbi:hypothetical protein HDU76_011608 [Blyttiomyces sp. JEL0837]|nr:hypothetical protein HDU76_011608 [Blyttiomyces sp. JEL0837]